MNDEPKGFSRAEEWIADHATPLLLTLAALILGSAIAVVLTYRSQHETAERVKVIAPQVTKINRALCDQRSLSDVARAHRCAERIRVGLINCRHSQPCRAAWLALVTYPPPAREVSSGSALSTQGGDASQQPSSHGHQQPGPSKGHPGGNGNTQAPSEQPQPPQEAPGASEGAPGHTGENPGQSGAEPPGQSGANNGQTSGLGVEVCADLLNTCVGAEVGLGH